MNSNRTGTIFGIVSIALAGAAAILLSFAKGNVNPILTSVAVIFVVLAGLAGVHQCDRHLLVDGAQAVGRLAWRKQVERGPRQITQHAIPQQQP